MTSRREFILAGASLVAASALPIRSIRAAGADGTNYVKIDRRNASSEIEYRLIFTARVSGTTIEFPGHAYMMTGEYDSAAKVCRFDKTKIFGFYPAKTASSVKTYFAFPVPGEVGSGLGERA